MLSVRKVGEIDTRAIKKKEIELQNNPENSIVFKRYLKKFNIEMPPANSPEITWAMVSPILQRIDKGNEQLESLQKVLDNKRKR